MGIKERELDERSKNILRDLISHYCLTGEPVGSRTLSKKGKVKLSPATIRNVLSDLEDLGYIAQPHTSAGRIPTDKGYRFYVNHLLKNQTLNSSQKELIENRVQDKAGHVQDLLIITTELLAQLSSNIALAVAPQLEKMVLENIDFVNVSTRRVLAIIVTRGGVVSNKIIDTDENFTQDQLTRMANYIKTQFFGLTLPLIRVKILEAMKKQHIQYDRLLKDAMILSQKSLENPSEQEQLIVIGAAQIVSYPEFADISHTREILEALEEKSRILKLLSQCLEGSGIHILIGSEHQHPDLKGLSLISSPYLYDDQPIGTIGILGPKRMEYGKLIPLVEHIAKVVSNILTREN